MLKPIKLASNNFLSSLDTSSEEFFNIANITADNLSQKASQVRTNVDTILNDIKDNYGLRGLTNNAQIPDAYVRGFFESIAEELNAGNLKNPSQALKTYLHFL